MQACRAELGPSKHILAYPVFCSAACLAPAPFLAVLPQAALSGLPGGTSTHPGLCSADSCFAHGPDMLLLPFACLTEGAGLGLASPSDDEVSWPFFRRDFPLLNDRAENIPPRDIMGVEKSGRDELG